MQRFYLDVIMFYTSLFLLVLTILYFSTGCSLAECLSYYNSSSHVLLASDCSGILTITTGNDDQVQIDKKGNFRFYSSFYVVNGPDNHNKVTHINYQKKADIKQDSQPVFFVDKDIECPGCRVAAGETIFDLRKKGGK
jgi:hypothetical protein